MKSKTLIDKQLERKSNPELVETLMLSKKQDAWIKVASMLSKPRRKKVEVNLEKISQESKEGETIVIPGKVLGKGDIDKKIVIVALSYSKEAERKLKDKKCEILSIKQEIKKNSKAQGVKVLT